MNNIILLILCCTVTLMHASEHYLSTPCYINGLIGGISGAASMMAYAHGVIFKTEKFKAYLLNGKNLTIGLKDILPLH